MTAPLIAGVDYSSKAIDVALVRGRQLVGVETHPLGVDLSVQVGIISRVVMDLHDQGVAAVVMEERWARVAKGIGAALKVRDVSTRIETLAVAAGLKVSWVPINTWHATVLGNGGLRSDDGKRAAVEYVQRVFKLRLDSHNQADAICLGCWGASVLIRAEAART